MSEHPTIQASGREWKLCHLVLTFVRGEESIRRETYGLEGYMAEGPHLIRHRSHRWGSWSWTARRFLADEEFRHESSDPDSALSGLREDLARRRRNLLRAVESIPGADDE